MHAYSSIMHSYAEPFSYAITYLILFRIENFPSITQSDRGLMDVILTVNLIDVRDVVPVPARTASMLTERKLLNHPHCVTIQVASRIDLRYLFIKEPRLPIDQALGSRLLYHNQNDAEKPDNNIFHFKTSILLFISSVHEVKYSQVRDVVSDPGNSGSNAQAGQPELPGSETCPVLVNPELN